MRKAMAEAKARRARIQFGNGRWIDVNDMKIVSVTYRGPSIDVTVVGTIMPVLVKLVLDGLVEDGTLEALHPGLYFKRQTTKIDEYP